MFLLSQDKKVVINTDNVECITIELQNNGKYNVIAYFSPESSAIIAEASSESDALFKIARIMNLKYMDE